MMSKPKFRLEHVEAALRGSGAIISLAAQKLAADPRYLSCSRTTLRTYIKQHPSLQRVIAEIEDDTLDLAEGQLIKGITEGDRTFVIFYLKTKGKRRGYVEGHELTGKDGGPIEHQPSALLIMPDNGRDPEITGLPPRPEPDEEPT